MKVLAKFEFATFSSVCSTFADNMSVEFPKVSGVRTAMKECVAVEPHILSSTSPVLDDKWKDQEDAEHVSSSAVAHEYDAYTTFISTTNSLQPKKQKLNPLGPDEKKIKHH